MADMVNVTAGAAAAAGMTLPLVWLLGKHGSVYANTWLKSTKHITNKGKPKHETKNEIRRLKNRMLHSKLE